MTNTKQYKVKRNAIYAVSRTHKIQDIKYPTKFDSKKYLVCVCGWEGDPLDIVAYSKHRREAPPTDKGYVGSTHKSPYSYNRVVSVKAPKTKVREKNKVA